MNIQGDRFLDENFNIFLTDVINDGGLEPASVGIAKRTLNKGIDSLNANQRYVLNRYVLDTYYVSDCKLCGNDIEWLEMTYAYDNGGFCSGCRNTLDKDD